MANNKTSKKIFAALFFICLCGYAQASEGYLWVVDQHREANEIRKFTPDGKKELLRVGGFNVPTFLDIDKTDESIWLTDTANHRVAHFSKDGEKMDVLEGIGHPYHLVICDEHRMLWIADSLNGEIIKYSLREKKELFRVAGFTNPHDIAISPYDRSIWIADEKGGTVARISHEGKILSRIKRGYLQPKHLCINPNDGSCVVTCGRKHSVVKIAANGTKVLWKIPGFGVTYMAAVNPLDDSYWVSDLERGEITKISSEGKILKKVSGFDRCRGLSPVDLEDKTFWLGNWGAGEIIKLNTEGEILQRIGGFKWPRLVVVNKIKNEVIWVTDRPEAKLIRVTSEGEKKIIKLDNFKRPVDVRIDQRDGSVWVNDMAESFNHQIAKLSSEGEELFRLSGFIVLGDAGVDPDDGSYYAVDRMIGELVKISSSGEELFRIKDLSPIKDLEGMGCLKKTDGCHSDYKGMDINYESAHDVEVSPVDSSVWLTAARRLLKFDKQGQLLAENRGIGVGGHVAIAPDGSCWLNNIRDGRVLKVSPDGAKILGVVSGLEVPFELSVSPIDSTCWVTTREGLVQISADGRKVIRRVGGFLNLQDISVISPYDGSFWAADFYGTEIIKFSKNGRILKRVKGFKLPRFLEVYWGNAKGS
ncbi:MAG: hypothetical protein COV72_08310 [Candidatus Omnitrophica bacterium CG11_big_fil_rev_8_21_14_0_20_42_13]|uniref:SMP-30/Gluconolactonase/LRE-like region domain-containing protein n=1 Tax=Candidatus Ghiorseimicrobium undicola TaxID=1974746 RepID=A0A2H0LVN2_9BACT|nr:MAG: hypothetical protein COV72_08310 [Candidatus Omnitrophica bacterium CG11_big_fil_rev_8_21_14_0_20_42_13]